MGNQPHARPLPTQDNTNRINVDKHPFLEWDSNPIPAFERAKIIYALNRAATVTGFCIKPLLLFPLCFRLIFAEKYPSDSFTPTLLTSEHFSTV
jgi:hypothetical protein